MDFRGFDSSAILILRGRILMSVGDFPGKFESSNVSRDNVSREIGRNIVSYSHGGFLKGAPDSALFKGLR